MQFFVYYVFWPFMGGAGFIYTGLMHTEYMWYFLVGWFLPWIAWPIGTYRRRQMNALIDELEAEAEKTGEANAPGALALAIGPLLIMVLSGMLGSNLAPLLMEEVMGIDVQARIEEIQENVKREGHP